MGMSPSEKAKLLKDVREMKATLDDANKTQDSAIMHLTERLNALDSRLKAQHERINQIVMDQSFDEKPCEGPVQEKPKKAKK
jgi:hypothetical protein